MGGLDPPIHGDALPKKKLDDRLKAGHGEF
jgi:hypothetical protein